MAQYSIRELEELSGIKAHTIRMWEKRYRIVSPLRTSTNIRFYTDDDLKKVMNIALLNSRGFKISKIASLSATELTDRVTELSKGQGETLANIDRLVMAMVDLNEESFEAILSELIKRFGFEKTIVEIAYPFLEKIGVMWQTGKVSPLQEHFISNLLRQKILVAIDALPLASRQAPRVILFLGDEELHELGLMFSHYIAKKSGFRTYYLGQRVPLADVEWFCRHHTPAAMITSITTSPTTSFVQGYLQKLCSIDPHIAVLASGYRLSKMALRMPKNLHLVTDSLHLKSILRELRLL